ncbi:MAG: ATP-dependent protease ATPase subunit HslU [Candidatus Hydrothermae bacterium]|nr:ATP-dependent protease ATPase subunit HslU [Candidatus Hydrothermae bacterium]
MHPIPAPRELVQVLDRYIVGQARAKRAVAVAIRNRWRRLQLPPEEAREILPSNLLMIGPTGVGKTEIARRVAQIVRAPFVKVEATRFTEVGYVGRDVESMIRDLADQAYHLVREEEMTRLKERLDREVEDVLLRKLQSRFPERTAEALRSELRAGMLEEVQVEVEAPRSLMDGMPMGVVIPGMEGVQEQLMESLESLLGRPKTRKQVPVREARELLRGEIFERLHDPEKLKEEARRRAESLGIVFLDEMDKLVSTGARSGPDVSREGVQRDLLPIVEGTTVRTRLGMIRTDHVLFIAAGAFQTARPQDLIPELQGRFPLRVELHPLSREDLRRILEEPESSLVRQYQALCRAEGVTLTFTPEALDRIAYYADLANREMENIGARRLHSIMGWLMEDLLFDLPRPGVVELHVDAPYVEELLTGFFEGEGEGRYIL